MHLVAMIGVTKAYRLGETVVPALRGVDLTVNRGEFAAIWGPSGSGKTTLLNLIGTIDLPSSGCVRFDDQDVADLSDDERTDLRNQAISFVFQGFNLVPVLSVANSRRRHGPGQGDRPAAPARG